MMDMNEIPLSQNWKEKKNKFNRKLAIVNLFLLLLYWAIGRDINS
jgi:hypothetical protein